MEKLKLLRCPKTKRPRYGLRKKKKKIPEVSEFLIWPYEQNCQLENLGKFLLVLNFDWFDYIKRRKAENFL